jgi:hypothetical protein
MRKTIHILLLPAIALIGVGCDQSFSPKVEFQEQYVLQCFIEVKGAGGSSPTVTVVLARTYDVNGVDPAANTVDPAIAGAEVTLTVNQKSYYLVGSQRTNADTARYHSPQWVYSKSISLIKPDDAVSVVAKLPNGKTLSAHSTIPSQRNFSSNYDFTAGVTSPFNLQPGKPNWTISWDNHSDLETHLFVPRLTIAYTKMVGGDEVAGKVTVPLKFVSSSGGIIPVYSSISSQEQCSFEFAALDSAMANIAAGDLDKSKYGVHYAELDVIEYDLPLSKYYSSINGSLDQYSIRTEQSVYSNVGGGIGILGSYLIHWMTFDFDERYVHRFGYRFR